MSAADFSLLMYDFGRWSGLIALVCLGGIIISGDLARFFDRYFGLDRIIKFQRKFAVFNLAAVVLHPVFFILASQRILGYLIPDFSGLPLAMGIAGFYIFIAIYLASVLYKRISYRAWQYLHAVNYGLFGAVLYHAVKYGSDAGDLLIKILYVSLCLLMALGLIYRGQYKIRQRLAPKFYVKRIQPETHDTYTLVLESERQINFQPGQFCFLRLNKNKLHARHPFSMSSAPGGKELRFTIKKSGRFTQAAEKLQPGEEVKVDGPFGRFTIKNRRQPLVFMAGGVGIAPFMSMIRAYSRGLNATLLYGSKNVDDIIFKSELDELSGRGLKVVHVLSQEKNPASEFEIGFIDDRIIKKHVTNAADSIFYICGPELMKQLCVKCLKSLGVKKRNIKYESFFW